MAKRGIPEINAGSMADIAFLLLIFFMVVTTLEEEMGIQTNLPPAKQENQDNIIVKERNVLIVKVNKFNQILVNNKRFIPADSLDILYDKVREFYDHPDADESLPLLTKRNISSVKRRIAKYKSYIAQGGDRAEEFSDSLEIYNRKLLAVQLYGEYKELPDNAVISLQNDFGTQYETYVIVRDNLQRAINDMRDELTQPVFKMGWDELKKVSMDKKTDPNKAKEYGDAYKALQQVVPMRIAEKSPKDTGN